jgi:hypothetical protein
MNDTRHNYGIFWIDFFSGFGILWMDFVGPILFLVTYILLKRQEKIS